MLPRKTALTRLLSFVAFFTFCCWLWLSASNSSDGVILDHSIPTGIPSHVDFSAGGQKPSRSNTSVAQSHHHTNESLEHLRKNMTIWNVNMSDVGAIVDQIRESIDTKVAQVPNNGSMDVNTPPQRNIPVAPVPNPHPFKYILNGEHACKDNDVFLLVYVHTAPSHHKRRTIIRHTWGNPKYYPNTLVRVIFIMGKTDDKPEVQQALEFESEEYGDIVQEDFEDSYKNLTYKGIAGLKWISNYCSHSKFVLKTDDDIFVNMFTLLTHLQSLDKFGVSNTNLLMCLVWTRMKVMREGKWKVDESEFKDTHYPTYCSGSAFTMSTDVAIAIHNISYQVPFFWVDDFYITGLLPMKLGTIKHKQFMSTYVLDGRKLEEKFNGPQWFTFIFSHVHDLNKVQSVWEQLVKLANGKASAHVPYALPGQLPEDKEKKP